MGLISKAALAGYILEETLAHLIRNNGYRLINGAAEDPDALMQGGHGLLVRGRGASHQADVLGELDLPTPFALPVRLFVEAKHRREKSDLRDVRNAHGVISDVNEHYATIPAKSYRQPLRRFQYRYALFSTSGFRSAAQTFALAQQISLIDLSGPAFAPLRHTVDTAAQALLAHAVSAQLKNFPIRQMRLSLRGTLSQNGAIVDSEPDYGSRTSATDLPPGVLWAWSADLASDLEQTGVADSGLLLGFPPAPFVLVMRPDSMSDVERYVDQHGSEVRVDICFDRRNLPAGDWTITPQSHPDAFALRFGLPGALERWLLTAPGDVRRRAMQAKKELLSSISVFLNGRLIRLLSSYR